MKCEDCGTEPRLSCRCATREWPDERASLREQLLDYEITQSTGRQWLAQIADLQAKLAEALEQRDSAQKDIMSDERILLLAARVRREALEEAAGFVEGPPVGAVRHEENFKLWGFTPRALQEDLARGIRALARDEKL